MALPAQDEENQESPLLDSAVDNTVRGLRQELSFIIDVSAILDLLIYNTNICIKATCFLVVLVLLNGLVNW